MSPPQGQSPEPPGQPPEVAVLAGGYGAALLLEGLVRVVPADAVTAVVNCGDDFVLHGLNITPDLDTVTYCLAGALNPETGWGLAGESWQALEMLQRLGGEAWFGLGDRDLGTHLYRTQRLAEGASLSTVTAELATAWGVGVRLLPVTDDRLQTRLTLAEGTEGIEGLEGFDGTGIRRAAEPGESSDSGSTGREIGFQEYYVKLSHDVPVQAVRFAGAAQARPAPGVVEALTDARVVVIAPSNPIVSIGPLMAVDEVRRTVAARRGDTVAISPIVAGESLRGPAARLMAEMGQEPSVVGVARLYAPLAATLVVDTADAHLADAVEAAGVRCVVAPAIMHSPESAADLARAALAAVGYRPRA